jgi:serine/threonine protein kinase
MNYPLISEYVEAIKAAEDNFEEFSYLRPVLDDDGLPVMTSGNFAVVFKMKDERDEKYYAVKCFTKEQEGREVAYHQITEELKNVSSPYLTSVRYLDKELFVDTDQTNEIEFPVLLMDWVEGMTLDKYLRANLDDKFALEMLAYRFSQLAQWLIPQPFAHGDLKPDNILVREDGTLVLVDYDGMYVPAMKGQKARELGSPDFRHPQRTENDFDEHIDDFPLVSIFLSLEAISIEPLLLKKYGLAGRLLFSENDYRSIISSGLISKCESVKHLPYYYPIINRFKRYLWDLLTPDDVRDTSLDFSFHIPVPKMNRITYVTRQEELDSTFTSSFIYNARYKYSDDGSKLLRFIDGVVFDDPYLGETHVEECYQFQISPATITICDNAFKGCRALRFLTIPDTVKFVGCGAFAGCYMKYIKLPLVDCINEDAFVDCLYLHTIAIPIGTFPLFSKMLPNNINQLREININAFCNRIKLYLCSNKEKTPFDLMRSLFVDVSTFCYLQNSEKISYIFDKYNNDGSCCITIEEHDSLHSSFHINNTEDIDELSLSICCLLLDAGLFNSVTNFSRYLNRLK